jgi:hypothetical protein
MNSEKENKIGQCRVLSICGWVKTPKMDVSSVVVPPHTVFLFVLFQRWASLQETPHYTSPTSPVNSLRIIMGVFVSTRAQQPEILLLTYSGGVVELFIFYFAYQLNARKMQLAYAHA